MNHGWPSSGRQGQMAIATLDGQILALGSGPFSPLNWPDGDGYLRCARQLAEI
jgi:hypothetical protein